MGQLSRGGRHTPRATATTAGLTGIMIGRDPPPNMAIERESDKDEPMEEESGAISTVRATDAFPWNGSPLSSAATKCSNESLPLAFFYPFVPSSRRYCKMAYLILPAFSDQTHLCQRTRSTLPDPYTRRQRHFLLESEERSRPTTLYLYRSLLPASELNDLEVAVQCCADEPWRATDDSRKAACFISNF